MLDPRGVRASLKPWISIPDFVSQLWSKIRFFYAAVRQNHQEWKASVQSQTRATTEARNEGEDKV